MQCAKLIEAHVGNIIKKSLFSFAFEETHRISLSCKLVPAQYREYKHFPSEMLTLPLLTGDLRSFASTPALLLWYINLPLFTSTINISTVGNFCK